MPDPGYTLHLDVLSAAVALHDAAQEGLLAAGEHWLQVANETVPLEYGDLARSGRVSVGDGEVAVSYSTPYAVPQHEHTEYQHKGQGRAKWLELSGIEEAPTLAELIGAPIQGRLR